MSSTRIAIAGLGTIGRALARRLADGVPGVTLACAAARDHAKAQAWLDEHEIDCPLVELGAFPQHADLAIGLDQRLAAALDLGSDRLALLGDVSLCGARDQFEALGFNEAVDIDPAR